MQLRQPLAPEIFPSPAGGDACHATIGQKRLAGTAPSGRSEKAEPYTSTGRSPNPRVANVRDATDPRNADPASGAPTPSSGSDRGSPTRSATSQTTISAGSHASSPPTGK
ncbi:MAG: hypothetical protein ACYTEX_25920, partial [Planctomycetota bacterium]